MQRTLLYLTGLADYSSLQTLDGLHSVLNTENWSIRTAIIMNMTVDWLKKINPSAVIIEPLAEAGELVDYCEEKGIPYVSLGFQYKREPVVRLDEYGAGREIALALLDRGFHNFGLIREAVKGDVSERFRGYIDTVSEAGFTVHESPEVKLSPWLESDSFLNNHDQFEFWLDGLPKPIGMLALSPLQGYGLVEQCRKKSIQVPESLAVIVTYENPIICEMAPVSLSAMRIGYQSMGQQTGLLIEGWLESGQPSAMTVVVPVNGIVHRESSDVVGAEDEVVSRVARWISQNIERNFSVKELLPVSGLSRPVLERRFRKILGRTPLQEIHRQRFQKACERLRKSNDPIGIIGQQCGFSDPFVFSAFFKKMAGFSPSDYRLGRKSDVNRQAILVKSNSQS